MLKTRPAFLHGTAVASAALVALTLSLLPAPVRADQQDHIVFDVTLKGIRAAELRINGKIVGDGYGANGTLKTTGLIGAIRKLRYDTTVNGHTDGTRFAPMRYEENADTPSRQSSNTIVYKSGTPVSVAKVPPRPRDDRDLDPRQQNGTVDPLTALYAVLRDVDRDAACKLNVAIFDGARRSSVQLSQPETSGQMLSCRGEYRRVAGFSDNDMKEKSRFPFTLTYAPAPNGRLQVVEISTDTVYGKARLKRQ
ncbi:hypothetical protein BFP70_16315 [Thioclava sp. SK-1]|uniref:DUF3108 domain-containing protein n=1 Tax=Thioclava sp. SK-1 TaxID=1889770 RepID=UPI00082590F1|nr:DUF3108 domain-containing protein [Thioclava sp. SK-1]OCX61018.1 hypothetical protein BFP70_16315 [Thioclava sp. SK-1]